MPLTDPVCGARVDVEASAVQAVHDGWAFFFGSKRCQRRFAAAPERFAGQVPEFTALSAAE